MDISFARRKLSIATAFVVIGFVVVGCTETAYVKLRVRSETVSHKEISAVIEALGWVKHTAASMEETVFELRRLQNYFLSLERDSPQGYVITMVATGTKQFSDNAIYAYQEIVNVMQEKFGGWFVYERQTSSGQFLQ